MRFCPRTGRLYVTFRTGGVWTYDPETGEERRPLPPNARIRYFCPAISGDGRTVVLRRFALSTTSPDDYTIAGYAVADDGTLAENWTRPDRADPIRFDFTYRPRTDQLFGPHGLWHGRHEFVWVNARTGAAVGSISLAERMWAVAQWALAADGEQVAWLCEQALYVQRLDEPAPRVLPAGADEYRRGLAFHPSGRLLAYTTGPTVRLIDADTLDAVRAYDWGAGKARTVAFSPDGLRAAVSAEGGRGWVTVFDLEF
jgi:hypothetical protein